MSKADTPRTNELQRSFSQFKTGHLSMLWGHARTLERELEDFKIYAALDLTRLTAANKALVEALELAQKGMNTAECLGELIGAEVNPGQQKKLTAQVEEIEKQLHEVLAAQTTQDKGTM